MSKAIRYVECAHCGETVGSYYVTCPYCGYRLGGGHESANGSADGAGLGDAKKAVMDGMSW